MTTYFVDMDAYGDTWIWRANGDRPEPVLARFDLRNDRELWDRIVAMVTGTDAAAGLAERVERAIDTHSFGVAVPGARAAHHNGAHDVIRVDDLRGAMQAPATAAGLFDLDGGPA